MIQENHERTGIKYPAVKRMVPQGPQDSTKKRVKTGNKMGTKEYYRVKAKKMDKQVKSKIKRLEKLKRGN